MDAWNQIDNEIMTLIFQFPQLRPRSHLKDINKYKFVGSCIDGQLHFNGVNDRNEMSENLKEFLEEFPLRLNEETPNKNVLKKAKTFLVYVSKEPYSIQMLAYLIL